MALITRSSTASIDTGSAMHAPSVAGDLYAGEDLDVAAPCYIKSADGKVYMSNGTSADEAAEVVGFTARACKTNEAVTLFGIGARFRYGSSLTVGDVLYLGATAGRLDSAPTTGDAFGYAQVVSSTDIIVIRGMPVLTSATVGAGTIGTTELAASGVTEAKIAPNTLTGLVAKNVADANVIGGLPVVHRIDLAAGAVGNTDVTITHKTRVIDAWLVLRGAGVATCTVQVKNGTTAITDAMAASGSDQAVVRCASLNDAAWEVAAGGTLRITSATGATQPDCTVYVLGVRVA